MYKVRKSCWLLRCKKYSSAGKIAFFKLKFDKYSKLITLQPRILHNKSITSFHVLCFHWFLVFEATRLLLVSRQAFVILLYKSDTTRMVWVESLYSVKSSTHHF